MITGGFNVEEKGQFPILFSRTNNLNYVGPLPDIQYFKEISKDDYENLKLEAGEQWNFKEESIRYCEQDCRTLYQILIKYNELVYSLFSMNIWKYPTLPSLSFACYRASEDIEKYRIPLTIGNVFKNIQAGYTGGATDVYIPYSNKPVYVYDKNSLYPFSMLTKMMPVGLIKYFEGDITQIDPKAFGFFNVTVTSPEYLHKPILQTKVKTPQGTRTIAALGTWEDCIFSEEMYNAEKFGYTFKIHSGYQFEKALIFENYITKLYRVKANSPINSAMYLISKLLMNSLYGRFGLNSKHTFKSFVSESTYLSLEEDVTVDVLDHQEFGDDTVLVEWQTSLDDPLNTIDIDNWDEDSSKTSIGIAAATAAYSRVEMTEFKKPNSKLNLIYTDTDCVMVNESLDPILIGPGLGQFKLEYVFKESIFIAPKVYGGYIEGEENSQIAKVKGLKTKVDVSELKTLLVRDESLTKNHEKMYRDYVDGNIKLKDEAYLVRTNDSKRIYIYDENNVLVATKPYTIDSSKEIKDSKEP